MRRLLLPLALLLGAVIAFGYASARADPLIREVHIALPDWPAGAQPQRVILVGDMHIGSPAMDAARLARIVRQIDALSPDLVLIAGDFVFGHDPQAAIASARALEQPLSGLHARLGTVAVLGNHDYWTQPMLIRGALERAGVNVLDNDAVQLGPLAIGGVSDSYSGHQNVARTLAAMARIRGARIVLTHSPDLAAALPPSVPLLLAGHTHCGQAVMPFWGPISKVALPRYLCGVMREGLRTIVVTGGLGTSGPPLRYGAPPDLWVVTVGPQRP